MFQESETELTGLQRLAGELTADRNFKPSRQKVLNALASLLDATELHRAKSIGRIPSTTRVPGWLSELEERLLPFVRDPVGTALRLGIRRLGEIASEFMAIEEMTDVAKEAAAQSGDPGVREVIVDKQWNGLRDRNGDIWIA
jgi:hypothetical protein